MTLILPEKSLSLSRDLRRLIGPTKVKDDAASLKAYAVDAGIYRLPPRAVVLPENEEDIEAIVAFAMENGVPLTPRAAGTNLTGSAIGEGVIVDISRMNRMLEVNREARWARVQPGIVLAELNKRLAPLELMYGPDPSSGEMCKLGGMLANNSAGPHTLRYGAVKDNVHELRVRTGEGWLTARAYRVDDPVLAELWREHPSLEKVAGFIRESRDVILAHRPRVSKNSAGYNVFDVSEGMDHGILDLTKLFVGSEGTLGIFSEATLRLVDRPRATVTGLLHFRDLGELGEAVPELLELQPDALEVMDANTLDLIGRHTYGIPADATATLLIEFDQGSTPGRTDRLMRLCRRYRLADKPALAFDQEHQAQLWRARKALYPTLYRYDPKKKPINFVDDVVVAAQRTGELIRYLETFFERQSIAVAIFGHIGNGNAHIVPLLDVNDPRDFERMVEAYRAIHRSVLEDFGGSICGEHGDGRVRAELVRTMFGEDLYRLFVRIKQELDPAGIFNPGVKISDTSFTEHIDFDRLAKPCATCAKCNAVCPVYDVFQSEDMSSRGWFEIVTAQDYRYLDSKRVVEACLNCKSCRAICPADVDVAELILQRRAEHPNRLAGWIFALHARSGLFESLVKWAGRTQEWWDRPTMRAILEMLTRPLLRQLDERAKLPRNFRLPRLATRTLRERYSELCGHRQTSVAYFHGCAANYFQDGVGDAVIAVLRKLGIEPALPPQRCSGTPIDTYGYRQLAKDGARENLEHLAPYETVVTGCASCTLSLKDYVRWFRGEPEYAMAEDLARRVKHISEFVVEHANGELFAAQPSCGGNRLRHIVTYHSSCHLRAAGVTTAPRRLLARLPGVQFVEMADADRCAGGAGTYVIKAYETSMNIFERKRQAIMDSGADIVATSCPACMIQLRHGLRDSVTVKHVAQLLDESIAYSESRNA
ncbi:MAG: FAD-binding oxidoreductase [Nitrospirae bacterium]|nr:MAG: FAD-binding oxidoreductase [Nitrospirota bacterium]